MTTFDNAAEFCSVHNEPLRRDKVLLMYGLYRYSAEYYAARSTLFPYSKFYALGGCMPGDDIFTEVRYCQSCRNQHDAWCAEHGVNFGLALTPDAQESYIRRMSGHANFSGIVPTDVPALILQGKFVAAIKSLKAANPQVEIHELRAYTTYLKRKYQLEKIISHSLSAIF